MKIVKLRLNETVCYLIPVENKYLLIDTGYEKHKHLFRKRLRDLNISVNDLAYVLLTHHHDDHCGLLNEIKAHNPACKIIMHAKAIPHLQKGKDDLTNCKYINAGVGMMMKTVKRFNKKWDFAFPPYEVRSNDIVIERETALKTIGIKIPGKIIYTPGHTDDSIALLLDNGICFTGDAASNMLRFMGTRYCVIFMADLNQYYKNWERLIAEKAKMIYPAHGKPFKIEKLKNNLYKNKEERMIRVED
jgi:glyoxylase-like metal-dependent hydrolase (beta-lactamase superfamily II)